VDALAGADARGARGEPAERGRDGRPRARGVDHGAGREPARLPGEPVAVAHGHDLARALAPLDALDRGADPHPGPALDGVDRVGDAEASAVDAPLVERHGPDDVGLDARLEAADLLGREAGVGLAALVGLVAVVRLEEGVDEGQHDLGPAASLDREDERDAEQEVGRDGLDVAGVAARLLGDLGVVREVADAPVDHAAGVAAGAEGEVVPLEEGDLEASHGGVAGDAGAVHAAADNHHVHVHVAAARR